MTPEEFNKLKEEEKAHLRQLRDLKQKHREVQRKASILGALRGMRNEALEADTEAQTDALMRGAVTQEARLELAMEAEAEQARADADREALRQAEAAELVRQMKADAGATLNEAAGRPGASSATGATAPARTIGRTPPPEPEAPEPPAEAPRGAKSLGRPRG